MENTNNKDLTNTRSAADSRVTASQKSTSTESTDPTSKVLDNANGPRPMRVMQFIRGMLLASIGVGLMLAVAFGVLHGWGIKGDMTMPVIGLCMILGLMFLGGGFGLMATASGTFDDDEFDRLMAGENRHFDQHMESPKQPTVVSPMRHEMTATSTGRKQSERVELLQYP